MKWKKEKYDPKKHFYSEPIASYLSWRDKKDKWMNKIGKILLYGFLAFAGISILGLFIVLIVSHFYNPDVNNQTTLTGFFDPLWHKIEDGCWYLVRFFGMMCHWLALIFISVGGTTMLEHFLKDEGFRNRVLIIGGASIAFFMLMLIIRAVMISYKDPDEGHELARRTPGIIFWSISTIILIPIVFIFVNTIMQALIFAFIQQNSGEQFSVSLFNASWNTGTSDCSTWDAIMNKTGWKLIEEKNFSSILCLVAWCGGIVVCGLFTWYCISLIFCILYDYIILFPAMGKWPQDEGGSAMAIRDDIVANFVHVFFLYFFFSLMTVILAGIRGAAIAAGLSGFGTGILTIIYIVSCGITGFKMSKKAPSFFSEKNSVSYATFSDAKAVGKGAWNGASGTVNAGTNVAKSANEKIGITTQAKINKGERQFTASSNKLANAETKALAHPSNRSMNKFAKTDEKHARILGKANVQMAQHKKTLTGGKKK